MGDNRDGRNPHPDNAPIAQFTAAARHEQIIAVYMDGLTRLRAGEAAHDGALLRFMVTSTDDEKSRGAEG